MATAIARILDRHEALDPLRTREVTGNSRLRRFPATGINDPYWIHEYTYSIIDDTRCRRGYTRGGNVHVL